ncbi:MAG TPA: Rieske 2Fe-2S domain-containing protein [Dehalococcoidia bacterium]|nr:Rieske 2Fe-2S domain-containing protein [Dehalococcoidia bacterium]
MLSNEENELLTRTGPGTPMGEYFRRYWMPVLMASELPEADCPPVRVQVLGEKLVAFKDSDGNVGLLDEICPHRRASLFWGRNEEQGLRCVYHGWKFDTDGNCVDMPNEPAEYEFKRRVRTLAYPAQEYGGLIWAYMGPKELTPELPQFEWALVRPDQRAISKRFQETNYLQAVEGGIDSSHSNFLHATVDAFRLTPQYWESVKTWDSLRAKYHPKDKSPVFTTKRTDFGVLIGARRNAEEDSYYWRITQYLLPAYTMIPADPGKPINGHVWTPIDDEHCWAFSFTWTADGPLPPLPEDKNISQNGIGIHADVDPKTFKPLRNQYNDYMIDRQLQKTKTMTGILGTGEQDMAVQESMGICVDRSLERLGTSDTAIIAMRRVLLRELKALQEGKEPHAASHGSVYHVRSASAVIDRGQTFEEAARQITTIAG